MRRLIQGTDAEILARVARRRALNGRVAREERDAKEQALRVHVAARLRESGIDESVLDDQATRRAMMDAYRPRFVHTPTAAQRAKLDAIKALARAELPDEIKSERWSVGDCHCVLQRIYYRDTPDDAQTFHAVPCAAHESLPSLAALHDVIREETLRRGRTHRFIDHMVPGIEVRFVWSGSGSSRLLGVVAAMTAEQASTFRQWAAQEFGAAVTLEG